MATRCNILTLLVAVVIGLALVGCTVPWSRTSRSNLSASKAQGEVVPSVLDVLITRANPSLPSGCSPPEVATLITGFFNAVNQGDLEQIPHYFNLPRDADPYPKAWYSVSDTSLTHFVAYTEPDLLTYFRERHAHGEVLQLLMVDVSGPSWHGGVDITYAIRRQADDIATGVGSENIAGGKGAIDCNQQQIFVWSMVMLGADQPIPSNCPHPSDWELGESIIACARN